VEHRTLWQTAWGTIATIAGALVIGLLIADISASVPVLAIVAAGIVMLIGLYCVFAPVWGWPPFRRPGKMDSVSDDHSINVTSVNQSGGITVGRVEISSMPRPQIDYEVVARNEPLAAAWDGPTVDFPDDPAKLLVTKLRVTLRAAAMPPKLGVGVRCESLAALSFGLGRTGSLNRPDYGVGNGIGWATIDAPSNGTYVLNIATKKPEDDIEVEFVTQ
jgi:hypothetical protein